MADTDSMLFWLARAVTNARQAAERKQVHVAASASVDQSTLARFEKGTSWPRNPETFVDAYANDLDVDAIDLWEEAIRQWRAFREAGADDPADITEKLSGPAEVLEAEAARVRAQRQQSAATAKRTPRSRKVS